MLAGVFSNPNYLLLDISLSTLAQQSTNALVDEVFQEFDSKMSAIRENLEGQITDFPKEFTEEDKVYFTTYTFVLQLRSLEGLYAGEVNDALKEKVLISL